MTIDFRVMRTILLGALLASSLAASAQEEVPPPPTPGRVIVSDEHPALRPEQQTSSSQTEPGPTDQLPSVAVTDAERAAVQITAWDLDVHLTPADAREETRALLTIRNVGMAPLLRVPVQLSSTLRWQTVSGPDGVLAFTEAPVATDADHTGYAQEAVVTLAKPLAPGASVRVSAFYAGTIAQSSARLELLGASPERAANTDWDAIVPTTDAAATSLRGFGNVLWYPVAAPTALLGDGNKLFELIGRQRLLGLGATMRLRLTVEYTGDPPDAAILNGKLKPLAKLNDEQDALIDETHGVATAEYAEAPLGFRLPSLFLTAQHAETTENQMLSVVSAHAEAAEPYRAAAELVQPMLTQWLGPNPLTPLLLLDHAGEPFEDGAFLAAQLAADARAEDIAPALVRGLTHAWFQVPGAQNTWLDAGMPELMSLLWLERTSGRGAAIAQLGRNALPLALAEPDLSATPAAVGQPLTTPSDGAFLRLKAAAVLWQLRDILGNDSFRDAFLVFRHSLSLNPAAAENDTAFERSLERTSGKDLAWFFNDWVYRDRGLPDLTIVQVTPRALPARPGRNGGYLVAVEVRNDGDAVAEVPVVVRSGAANADTLSSTERLRILPHSSASTRVLFEGTPETVEVNDGSVPELRTTTHVYSIVMKPAA